MVARILRAATACWMATSCIQTSRRPLFRSGLQPAAEAVSGSQR